MRHQIFHSLNGFIHLASLWITYVAPYNTLSPIFYALYTLPYLLRTLASSMVIPLTSKEYFILFIHFLFWLTSSSLNLHIHSILYLFYYLFAHHPFLSNKLLNLYQGREKESVSFECVATGKPAPKYQWVNKDSEVLNKKEGYFVDEITGELRILDLNPHHSGKHPLGIIG